MEVFFKIFGPYTENYLSAKGTQWLGPSVEKREVGDQSRRSLELFLRVCFQYALNIRVMTLYLILCLIGILRGRVV